jgi:integrase
MKPPNQQLDPDRCRISLVKNDGAPWMVSYPTQRSGKVRRIRKSFASEERARQFAAEMDLEIAERGIRLGSLPPEVRRAYQVYLDASSELAKMEMDVPDFESLVRGAINVLHQAANDLRFTVAEAIEQFLAQKADHLQAEAIRSLQLRLRLFAKTFGNRPLKSITAAEINEWLTELPRQRKPKERSHSPSGLSALAINHYRFALSALFRHSKQEAWIASNPVSEVPRAHVKTTEALKPLVYNPAEAARIMRTALASQPEILPALALSMFAGLRVDEAAHTELSSLFPQEPSDSGQLVLPEKISKSSERHIPINDPLRRWLDAQPRRAGHAWEGTQQHLRRKILEILTISGVTPNLGAPRYTYIAHRWAQTRDIPKIISEDGIKFGTLKPFTLNPVSSQDAETFFSTFPNSPL